MSTSTSIFVMVVSALLAMYFNHFEKIYRHDKNRNIVQIIELGLAVCILAFIISLCNIVYMLFA